VSIYVFMYVCVHVCVHDVKSFCWQDVIWNTKGLR
jgi:hypothetical protein